MPQQPPNDVEPEVIPPLLTPHVRAVSSSSQGTHARRRSASKHFFRQFGVQPAIETGRFVQKVAQKSGGWVGSRIKLPHHVHSNGRGVVPEALPEEPQNYQFLLEWQWWLQTTKEHRGLFALLMLGLALIITTWPLFGYVWMNLTSWLLLNE
jgi:hypothetical protein